MVIALSLIPCTSHCVYQLDGCCTLERAASGGTRSAQDASGCVHFIGLNLGGQEGVSDGLHHDQL